MEYPKEFVDHCKVIYPDWPELHKALDSGSAMVGRYLDDSSSASIAIDTVLSATSLEELKAHALNMRARCFLYQEWCRLNAEQRGRS